MWFCHGCDQREGQCHCPSLVSRSKSTSTWSYYSPGGQYAPRVALLRSMRQVCAFKRARTCADRTCPWCAAAAACVHAHRVCASSQAEKFRSKAQKSDTWRVPAQYCRYLFYLGTIRTIQLEYSEAKEVLQQVGAGPWLGPATHTTSQTVLSTVLFTPARRYPQSTVLSTLLLTGLTIDRTVNTSVNCLQ